VRPDCGALDATRDRQAGSRCPEKSGSLRREGWPLAPRGVAFRARGRAAEGWLLAHDLGLRRGGSLLTIYRSCPSGERPPGGDPPSSPRMSLIPVVPGAAVRGPRNPLGGAGVAFCSRPMLPLGVAVRSPSTWGWLIAHEWVAVRSQTAEGGPLLTLREGGYLLSKGWLCAHDRVAFCARSAFLAMALRSRSSALRWPSDHRRGARNARSDWTNAPRAV